MRRSIAVLILILCGAPAFGQDVLGGNPSGVSILPAGSSGADYLAPSGRDYPNHEYDSPLPATNRTTNNVESTNSFSFVLPQVAVTESRPEPEYVPAPRFVHSLSVDGFEFFALTLTVRYELVYKDRISLGLVVDLPPAVTSTGTYEYFKIFDVGFVWKWQIVRLNFMEPHIGIARYIHYASDDITSGSTLDYSTTCYPFYIEAGCKFFLPSLKGPYIEPEFGVMLKQGDLFPALQIFVGYDFGRDK